jgi:hypothetical protein
MTLRSEFKLGFLNERARQDLRRLSAMTLAKHEMGIDRPNTKLVRKTAEALDKADAKNARE